MATSDQVTKKGWEGARRPNSMFKHGFETSVNHQKVHSVSSTLALQILDREKSHLIHIRKGLCVPES